MKDFEIEYGKPWVDAFMKDLDTRLANNFLTKTERQFFKKLTRCLERLAQNPRDPALYSHEIDVLSRHHPPYKIWESYLESNKPNAYRLFWIYHPRKRGTIVIVGIEPHPEKSEYSRLNLSMDKLS